VLYGLFIGTIVKQTLLPFECVKHPNGRLTLAAMPDVECNVGEQAALQPIGVLFLGVYVMMYFFFIIYVSYRIPQWTQNRATAKRFRFVHADFRAGCFWWGPVVVAKELLGAFTVALFPGEGGSQIVFMTFVNMAYTCLTAYFRPFPGQLTNRLDILTHAGIVIGTVFSLHFDKEEKGVTDECVRRWGFSCGSIWLFAMQLFFTITPAILVLTILLKARSTRVAESLSSQRKQLDALLQSLLETTPHPVWVDEISVILEKGKFDEVEISNMYDMVGALAASSGMRNMCRGVSRRFDSAPRDYDDEVVVPVALADPDVPALALVEGEAQVFDRDYAPENFRGPPQVDALAARHERLLLRAKLDSMPHLVPAGLMTLPAEEGLITEEALITGRPTSAPAC
jgi:hypothetical protein